MTEEVKQRCTPFSATAAAAAFLWRLCSAAAVFSEPATSEMRFFLAFREAASFLAAALSAPAHLPHAHLRGRL